MAGFERKEKEPEKYYVDERVDRIEIEKLKEENFELKKEIEKLKELITIDALTGLNNRRRFNEEIEEIIEGQKAKKAAPRDRPHRLDQGQFLVMLDIDHFKQINDEHGHPKGDEVLIDVSQKIKQEIRDEDFAARYGGEEFALILKNVSDEEQALKIIDRLRARINEDLGFKGRGGEDFKVTISAGLTSLAEGDEAHDFIDRADTAMYNSKRNGRDRVSINRNGNIEEYRPLTEEKTFLDNK